MFTNTALVQLRFSVKRRPAIGRAHVGAISSLGRPLPALVSSGGPFVLAFTRDLTGSYDLGIFLNALSAIFCFVSLFFVRPIRRSSR